MLSNHYITSHCLFVRWGQHIWWGMSPTSMSETCYGLFYIYTIMDNTYIALKKILNIMVPEKYPMVSGIKVIDDSHEYDNSTNYLIYLGVIPDELETLSNLDVREYIEEVSRYVLKGDETMRIVFYNPEHW